jgi:hypothetical protein
MLNSVRYLYRRIAHLLGLLLIVTAALLLSSGDVLVSASAAAEGNDGAARGRHESASTDGSWNNLRIVQIEAARTSNPSPLRIQVFGLLGSIGDLWMRWTGSLSDSQIAGKSSPDRLWQEIQESSIRIGQERIVLAKAYRTYQLNVGTFSELIAHVPLEFSDAAKTSVAVMSLPMPDGTFQNFRIVDSPISASPSADFRSFTGQGIEDPTAIAKIDWSQYGLHAMVLSSGDAVFIDPYAIGDITHYSVHYRRDTERGAALLCLSEESGALGKRYPSDLRSGLSTTFQSGTQLTTLRTAVALTSGYTNFFKQPGDSDAQQKDRALAALKTTMLRVNGIWERELAIRFQLLPDAVERTIIYTDNSVPADPYLGLGASQADEKNQVVLDAAVQDANYDIGHVFGTFSGGVGTAGAVVPGTKAKGATGHETPVGDKFDVDYVAHEIVHQFDGNHTFNAGAANTGSCTAANRNAPSAYEPGSGSTLASYAGICEVADLAEKSDDYFHLVNLNEVVTYMAGIPSCSGTLTGACADRTVTGNRLPTVSAGANFNIPKNTPFMLTATGSDPDADAVTFTWEEYDLGAASPPNNDEGNRPLFRSYKGTTNPSRTFPSLQYILNNSNTPPDTYQGPTRILQLGEVMPVTTRTMNFRVTARDNRAGGGGVSDSGMQVIVDAASGPFQVSGPNANVTLTGNTPMTVTWDVANTTAAPINCASVKISLSTDGGNTFPTVLAASTANDGSESVTVPNIASATSRIKIEAVGNIFFDISDVNFTITAANPTPTPTPTPSPTPQFQPTTLTSSQVDLKNWTFQGTTYVYVKLLFPNAGYRVVNFGQATRAGNDFTGDAAVERFTGPSVQAVTTTAGIYDLGALAPGNYNFAFNNTGTLVKTLAFTVTAPPFPANLIDDARQFVKQQYRDFLNREADQAGEDFWTDNITKCADPARRPAGQTEAQCTLRQRETTSGAFFLSPEFQYTGYYVLRMYQGALGRQPKLSEFLPDAQFVGNGIVVNGALSAAKINQNKADYAAQFVNCTDATRYRCVEFKTIYDPLNNTQYVDKLFETTGVNASAADRTALVNGLNGGTETRATILQKVVDGVTVLGEGNQQFTTTYGQAFYDQQFTRAFVQLEYFGYMKRDPDEAGYNFWLGKLNQFGGNFVNAEMALAFISSPEYRARFGQP